MKEIIGQEGLKTALKSVINDRDKVVVEFFTPTCVNCRMTQQLLERKEPEWTAFSVDASKAENKQLVDAYKVMSVPTVAAFYLYKGAKDISTLVLSPKYRGMKLIMSLKNFFDNIPEWYREVKGNLFELKSENLNPGAEDSTDYVLAHCIASDFGMYGGIAAQFVKRFNMRDKLVNWAQKNEVVQDSNNVRKTLIGTAPFISLDTADGIFDYAQGVYNLITKPSTGMAPGYGGYTVIHDCLENTKAQMKAANQHYIAMPRIGCGIDGLDWNLVKEIILEVFNDSGINVLIVTL